MIVEVVALGLTCYNLSEKNSNNKAAKRIREKAFKEISNNDYDITNCSTEVDIVLDRLSKRRQSVFEQTFSLFIKTMEPLDILDLLPQDQLLVIKNIENKIEEYEKMLNRYSISKTEITKIEAVGSYFLFGIAGYYRKKSELTLEQSKIMSKTAKALSLHAKNIIDFLKYISLESQRMEDVTIKFNVLLIKSIRQVQNIIEKNGDNKKLYSLDDREMIMLCCNIADALKKLCCCNPFENDELSNAFIEVIEFGNSQFNNFEHLVQNQVNNLRR